MPYSSTMPKLLFELHAKTPRFRRMVRTAQETITDALTHMRHAYIAFSGGKDSSALLHLVRALAPAIPAVWSDDEWNLPETLTLIEQIPNLHRIAARVQHAEWFKSWDTDTPDLPAGTIWVDAPANDGLQTFAKQQGYDGALIGLRADENSRRRQHLKRYGTLHYTDKHGVWQCNPLAWWSDMDVWAYIHVNAVPYSAAYDKLAALGVPMARWRTGPLAQGRVLGYGQLAILKRGWPDLYNRFVARYPEASTYV